MINHYFNNINAKNEQNLVEDLTVEAIKIHGMDIFYLPRTLVNEDKIFGEDTISKFTDNRIVEMYLETVNGFGGQGDLLSKFGLQVKDTASFVVSKKRFQKETGMDRPLEGDIIYLPLTKGFFEIKFVEHENPFYQMGKNYTFKLNVELFQFSQEEFTTGESEIDEAVLDAEYNLYLIVSGVTGNFIRGSNVYQYTSGSITGSFTGANCTAKVENYENSIVTLRKITGVWKASDTTNRYIASEDNSSYALVSAISDKIDIDKYDNNKKIETEAQTNLDVSITNPFGSY